MAGRGRIGKSTKPRRREITEEAEFVDSAALDAIEHWIYRKNPSVGGDPARPHLSRWRGREQVNYPCGTRELAKSVAALVAGRARPRSRGDRAAQPRDHRDRRDPEQDLRPLDPQLRRQMSMS
jgi:hypothetical protein